LEIPITTKKPTESFSKFIDGIISKENKEDEVADKLVEKYNATATAMSHSRYPPVSNF
jgi:hypothetical protein